MLKLNLKILPHLKTPVPAAFKADAVANIKTGYTTADIPIPRLNKIPP